MYIYYKAYIGKYSCKESCVHTLKMKHQYDTKDLYIYRVPVNL